MHLGQNCVHLGGGEGPHGCRVNILPFIFRLSLPSCCGIIGVEVEVAESSWHNATTFLPVIDQCLLRNGDLPTPSTLPARTSYNEDKCRCSSEPELRGTPHHPSQSGERFLPQSICQGSSVLSGNREDLPPPCPVPRTDDTPPSGCHCPGVRDIGLLHRSLPAIRRIASYASPSIFRCPHISCSPRKCSIRMSNELFRDTTTQRQRGAGYS